MRWLSRRPALAAARTLALAGLVAMVTVPLRPSDDRAPSDELVANIADILQLGSDSPN